MTETKELIERLENPAWIKHAIGQPTFDHESAIRDMREAARALRDCSFLKAQISHLEDALQNAEAQVGKLKKQLSTALDDVSRLRYPDTTGQ